MVSITTVRDSPTLWGAPVLACLFPDLVTVSPLGVPARGLLPEPHLLRSWNPGGPSKCPLLWGFSPSVGGGGARNARMYYLSAPTQDVPLGYEFRGLSQGSQSGQSPETPDLLSPPPVRFLPTSRRMDLPLGFPWLWAVGSVAGGQRGVESDDPSTQGLHRPAHSTGAQPVVHEGQRV